MIEAFWVYLLGLFTDVCDSRSAETAQLNRPQSVSASFNKVAMTCESKLAAQDQQQS
jgi:hypothetical protein